MKKYNCIASAAFGLEGIVSNEIKACGIDSKAQIGGATFSADLKEILYLNYTLRCADRIYLILKEGIVNSFDELYDIVYSIDWNSFLKVDSQIIVNAKCVKSTLMSPSDCQKITKKAIVNKLSKVYNTRYFLETGSRYKVDIYIRNNQLRVSLDTSGNPLNKRGYRILNSKAAIRESLAAALLNIAPWRFSNPLYDPCCGSATFLIEAARMVQKFPSGIHIDLDMTKWDILSSAEVDQVKKMALNNYDSARTFNISGSDIDADVLSLAQKHINKASYNGLISVDKKSINQVNLKEENGCFIVNPPYGVRMGEIKEARLVYKNLFALLNRHKSWGMLVISNDKDFEKYFGKKADKKRKLFNGALECNAFIYFPINKR